MLMVLTLATVIIAEGLQASRVTGLPRRRLGG